MKRRGDINVRRVWIPACAGMTLFAFAPIASTLRHTGEGRCPDTLPHRTALIRQKQKHTSRPFETLRRAVDL
jgi:hypothetical protein